MENHKYTDEQIVKRVINKYLFRRFRSLSMIKNGYFIYIYMRNSWLGFHYKHLKNSYTLRSVQEDHGIRQQRSTIFEEMVGIKVKNLGSDSKDDFEIEIPAIYIKYIKYTLNNKRSCENLPNGIVS